MGEKVGAVLAGKDLTYESYTAFMLQVMEMGKIESYDLMESYKNKLQERFAKVDFLRLQLLK